MLPNYLSEFTVTVYLICTRARRTCDQTGNRTSARLNFGTRTSAQISKNFIYFGTQVINIPMELGTKFRLGAEVIPCRTSIGPFFYYVLYNISKVTVTNETTVLRMCTMTTTKTVTKTSFPVKSLP